MARCFVGAGVDNKVMAGGGGSGDGGDGRKAPPKEKKKKLGGWEWTTRDNDQPRQDGPIEVLTPFHGPGCAVDGREWM